MSYRAYKVTTVKDNITSVAVHTDWDIARNIFWRETGPNFDQFGNTVGFPYECTMEVIQVEEVI
jgi:hypothetical protein